MAAPPPSLVPAIDTFVPATSNLNKNPELNVSVVLYKGAKKKKSPRFCKITETKTVTRLMFLFCRKALRNVELLKDLDWPLVQIMYFAKIVGFALE